MRPTPAGRPARAPAGAVNSRPWFADAFSFPGSPNLAHRRAALNHMASQVAESVLLLQLPPHNVHFMTKSEAVKKRYLEAEVAQARVVPDAGQLAGGQQHAEHQRQRQHVVVQQQRRLAQPCASF